MPLQVGYVPWVEGSGMGSTSCGALENPGEGGIELALPIFAGPELGAEGARDLLGTRAAHAEDGREAGIYNWGREKGVVMPSHSPLLELTPLCGVQGWIRDERGV